MNKQLIIGLCIGGLVATAGGALALKDSSPKAADIVSIKPITAAMEQEYAQVVNIIEVADPNGPRFAAVVDVQPVTQRGRDEEICETVTVTHQAPVKDENQIAGTAAGAVIGGVLGNQVGGGNGKKVATVAGAVVGGIIGKNVQANHQAKQTYETTERQCWIEPGQDKVVGYDVTYQIDGQSALVRMGHNPGKELPVVGGEVVTDKAEIKRLSSNKAPTSYEVFYVYGATESSILMPKAPKVGDLLLVKDGQVVTDAKRLAEIQASQNQVVAYQVTYKLGNKVAEARMTEKPQGRVIYVKNGQVIADTGLKDKESVSL